MTTSSSLITADLYKAASGLNLCCLLTAACPSTCSSSRAGLSTGSGALPGLLTWTAFDGPCRRLGCEVATSTARGLLHQHQHTHDSISKVDQPRSVSDTTGRCA